MQQDNGLNSTGNSAEGEDNKTTDLNANAGEQTVANNTTFGSGPSRAIPDGGNPSEEKQPKESTGKDSAMGGADGGTIGAGHSKETTTGTGE